VPVHVLGPEPAELADADPGVREQADDQLVPLRRRRELQLVDLVATQHVEDPPRQRRQLRLPLHLLPLPLAPCEELAHRPRIGVHAEPRQRPSQRPTVGEQRRREAVEHALVQRLDALDALGRAPRQEDPAQRRHSTLDVGGAGIEPATFSV
jgi:hypothetical protein